MSNNGYADTRTLHNPLGLLAELTHRCPLGCPYCSNPLAMDGRDDELDAATWARVFREAAGLGVLQVHLSGGEPASRRDLVDIMAAARNAGLYTNLITSGVGVTDKRLNELADAGLDHVQISIQDAEPKSADRIAGYQGAYARKRALAAAVVALKLPLTANIVIAAVVPDYYARFPKPCVGGWGRRSLNVTPAGRVLPCHAAESIPGLAFWSVKDFSL